jgi:predicted  nucleic acid-binding Zn-ribbon protein
VKNFDAHEIIALVIIFASFYIAIIKKFNPKFIEIDKKLDKIDLRFDKIDAKFDKIDQRFEKMDQRFEKIDQRFEKTDHRFEKIEKDIMELKSSSQTQYFDLKGDLMQIEKLLHKKNGCKLINSENDKETG